MRRINCAVFSKGIMLSLCASWLLLFCPAAPAGQQDGNLLFSIEAVDDDLPYETCDEEKISLLLSKSVYPAEDLHLDAIIWLNSGGLPEPDGELLFELREGWSSEGPLLWSRRVERIPGGKLFVSVGFPRELTGRKARLRLVWTKEASPDVETSGKFRISSPGKVSDSGRIRLTVPNDTGAVIAGAPITVGVPFPRGVLSDERNVLLTDEDGREIPLQTKVTGRWSRFGYIKWLLCDFTLDIEKASRELYLEYGPDVARKDEGASWVEPSGEGLFPRVDAGLVRFDEDGVYFDSQGRGNYEKVLEGEALRGAFVKHEDGMEYAVSPETGYRIEELGPEKAVILREDWYRDAGSGETFCKFVTRFVIHRGSPLARIFHTWIFTGDAWEDRVANMGWRFPAAEGFRPAGFLSSYCDDREWISGNYLLQHDYDKFRVNDGGVVAEGGRAPGVFAADVNETRIFIGNKNFWQNFPHELEFTDDSLVYHMWPKHSGPAEREITSENALRLWFAHEGERLDFGVPPAYTEDPELVARLRPGYTLDGGKHRYTINAQGTAKTAELWLLFVPRSEQANEEAENVMAGLENDTLRAVVDSVWQTGTGVFYEIHPEDRGNYAAEEKVYEQHALAPYEWIERVQIYGKWIWGDMVWAPDIRNRTTRGIYRGFRKSHGGWPYSWIPYARSGDSRYFSLADAATRYMSDVPYVHYADERALISVPAGGGERKYVPRPRGRWERYHIPWGHHQYWSGPVVNGYTDKCDYLWHSYYITGYHRARDVVMDWAALTRERVGIDDPVFNFPTGFLYSRGSRISVALLHSYVEMYEAVFDPWFLAAAHQIAENVHLRAFQENADDYDGRINYEMAYGQDLTYNVDRQAYEPRRYAGFFWQPGPREFHRFSGCERYKEFYLHYASKWDSQRHVEWVWNAPLAEASSYAYLLTGDVLFLQRARHWLDWAHMATYSGEPSYMAGTLTTGVFSPGPIFTPYYLHMFPRALYSLNLHGEEISPVPNAFYQTPAEKVRKSPVSGLYEWDMPVVAIRKDMEEALPIQLRVNQERRFAEGSSFSYSVVDSRGDVVREGAWDDAGDVLLLEIPAEAEKGIYRVKVRGESNFSNHSTRYGNRRMPALLVPLSPPGTPEVIELADGESIGESHYHAQYWFKVPEGVDEFSIEVGLEPYVEGFNGLVRLMVWDDSMEVIWSQQFDQADFPGRKSAEGLVNVPGISGGKLFRLTVPFFHMGISLDERIPGIFSVSRDRWFKP